MRTWSLLLVLSAVAILAAETPGAESLFQAVHNGDASAVSRLLRQGTNPDAEDNDGIPALMAATLYAGTDSVKALLDHGANPNKTNRSGATALMWAVPDLEKVKLLIARGADVNAQSSNMRRTPLLIAAGYPGSVEVLRLLISKGANLHAKDKYGMDAIGQCHVNGRSRRGAVCWWRLVVTSARPVLDAPAVGCTDAGTRPRLNIYCRKVCRLTRTHSR